MKNKTLEFSKPFEKSFKKLPVKIREAVYNKLERYIANPKHPSLRVKKIKGTASIWEMSITMNYRLTFEESERFIFLRKIGTHDLLNKP